MKNIVAAIDFSERTKTVLELATAQAQAFAAHLFIVHVAAPEPGFVGYDARPQSVRAGVAKHIRERHRDIQTLADTAREKGIEATALLVLGTTVKALLEEAKKLEADLIVMGVHGHGLVHRVFLGSVSQGVLKASPIPILFAPRKYESEASASDLPPSEDS